MTDATKVLLGTRLSETDARHSLRRVSVRLRRARLPLTMRSKYVAP